MIEVIDTVDHIVRADGDPVRPGEIPFAPGSDQIAGGAKELPKNNLSVSLS